MTGYVVAVFLLSIVAITIDSVNSKPPKPPKPTPTHTPCPQLYENCPSGTVPSNSIFNPAIGAFQLSCRDSPMPDGDCILLDDDNQSESFRCPSHHVLVGRDNQRPVCCKLQGICLTDCFIPKVLYSFKIGFEFAIEEGYALVGKYSYGMCSEDPTVFQIVICKLTPH